MNDRTELVMALDRALGTAACIERQLATLREAQAQTRAQLALLDRMLGMSAQVMMYRPERVKSQVVAYLDARRTA